MIKALLYENVPEVPDLVEGALSSSTTLNHSYQAISSYFASLHYDAKNSYRWPGSAILENNLTSASLIGPRPVR